MKFGSILATLALPASALVNTGKLSVNDDTLGPSMWIFGGDGLSVYSPDGSAKLKGTPALEICHNVSGYRGQAPSLSCSFYDVVSDGKKYVWAAVSRGVSKIDVFDIDTGNIAGSFETCNSPRDLEYHPLRDEVWVRCSGHNDYNGYMNSFSASSPSGASPSNILFRDNTTLNSWGFTVIDNSLGDVAYSSSWNQPILFKIDLSSKTVSDQFALPGAYGNYEIAYSRINKHVYTRASVCCTCGFEGADLGVDCGRYGASNVTVTTGPFAGSVNISGQCGRCDGTEADSIGVVEFDTNTDTVLGTHQMAEGFGGDPFQSPDGRHIVMFARNGGKTIRVLKANGPGQLSTVAFDLQLDFNFTGFERDQVFNDFAFVQYNGLNAIVFASATENKIAIVNIGGTQPTTTYVSFGSPTEVSSSSSRRQVEWVGDTPYVWVDGAALQEAYVFDVVAGRLIRTVTGVKTTKMAYIENLERKRIAALLNQMQQSGSLAVGGEGSSGGYKDDNDVDPVGIVGLILAALAVMFGVVNLVNGQKKAKNDAEGGDMASLGSKQVA